jgi:hypothetical protein
MLSSIKENEMSDQVEKYDEFEDLSLSAEKDGNSNLDEYGVWIKKKPSTDEEMVQDELHSNEGNESTIEDEKEVPFDFDGLTEDDSSCEDVFEKELKEAESSKDTSSLDSDFDGVDMSNFFTDIGSSTENEETEKKEDEEALKMDLNFDTVDSYMKEENNNDFDNMLSDIDNPNDSELDDFLSDLNSSTQPSFQENSNGNSEQLNGQTIDLNVDVDENQDFSNIGQTTNTEDSVILPSLTSESNEKPNDEMKEEPLVIKNTVVEPENIEEIRKENRKVIVEEASKKEVNGFSDIEALASELTSDISTVTNSFMAKGNNSVSVEGLDKITELLTEIVKELSSMKNEIATLKKSSRIVDNVASSSTKKDTDAEETTGFFKDEDTDEAIALTGDELNNILITADFTEENEPDTKVNETVYDEDMGTCEACTDDEKEKNEDDLSSEKAVDFDDITLENSKLDDFVIPEELDYSMLNNESEEIVSTEGSDMSYLDEKDAEDDVSVEIPETQDISIETSHKDTSTSDTEASEVLPSNIKNEVKSVLAYMDQLLESLPEDKMKEFAESEYFEMYNRLFSELGIS